MSLGGLCLHGAKTEPSSSTEYSRSGVRAWVVVGPGEHDQGSPTRGPAPSQPTESSFGFDGCFTCCMIDLITDCLYPAQFSAPLPPQIGECHCEFHLSNHVISSHSNQPPILWPSRNFLETTSLTSVQVHLKGTCCE